MTRERVREFQADVHRRIGEGLGYWPTTAAATRLLEEIGEVNELYLRRRNGDALREEICDVLLISTCLANQYCISLEDWLHYYESPDQVTGYVHSSPQLTSQWIGHLASLAGNIARSVNAYEGIKKPKEAEELDPLGHWIAALHGHLHSLLIVQGHDVIAVGRAVLDAKTTRDAGRFQQFFDPSTGRSLSSFRRIQTGTVCPFAPAAKLWGAPDWAPKEDVAANVARFLPVMLRFCGLLKWEMLDGIVVEISDPSLYSDIDVLARNFKAFLVALSSHDPTGADPFASEVRSEEWQFEFCGIRLFVIVFSPIYGIDSTRETYGERSTFVFLQPEQSFESLKIPRDAEAPVKREQIRELFAAVGKSYDCYIVKQPFEASRYLKPLHVDEAEVAWWK